MRAPKRKRPLPRALCAKPPEGVDIGLIVGEVQYKGSPEHKSYPSFAGPPRLRADAAKCDPSFKDRLSEIQDCLQAAVRDGRVGEPWESGFPRYVWGRLDGICYEARLMNEAAGWYKGYPLAPDELPEGL